MPWRERLGVASRVVAAIFGGYGLSALVATVLAIHLPGGRAEAAVTGMLVSFWVYALVVMWVFAVRRAAQAWFGLLLAALPLAALVLLHLMARAPA